MYLIVDKSGARRWAFMFWQGRKGAEIGLGSPLKGVTLPMARERAGECRRLLAEGGDPRRWNLAAKPVPDFQTMAEDVIAALESGWRNAKHTLPVAGHDQDLLQADRRHGRERGHHGRRAQGAPADLGDEDGDRNSGSAAGLSGSWMRRRLRAIATGRTLLGGAATSIFCSPSRKSSSAVTTRPMPWADVPAFIDQLRQREAMAARALEFTILTAARTGETLGARWGEIDLATGISTVPAIRMKAGREHRVPLTERAATILGELEKAKTGELVFPGRRVDRQLSGMAMEMLLRRMGANAYTVHGFRSSFKTWATEATSFPNELSEQALAHVTGNQVERAYRRTDVLERRREMMTAWAEFLAVELSSKVIAMKRVGT